MAKLKLRAVDAEDMSVISACLQDAIVTLGDMTWERESGRFLLVASRFCWEGCRDAEGGLLERVHAGVCFDGVTGVRHRGVDQSKREALLSLLATTPVEGGIHLEFAGGATIRLEAEEILCHLQDIDEPWPTQWRPSHPLEEG
ncbi:DUF2948 family protein [Stella humosa]|uniref:DUF2948 family protein n=1 Tax=Stella humosa TaxID=94 RepID=A0A3N1M0T4_9PROT|nr:DUF2948 family protein [Stella humosa]ROQ01114.1 DUF2948 family protein [Stella humosa]BBK31486.1 hypothetical protein STHU_21200 [Stella humosa]